MIKITVEDRQIVKPGFSILILVLSLLAGLLTISLVFALNGKDPLSALAKIFLGSFGSEFGLKETVSKAVPLILIGTGLTIAYKGKFWNIGAESQMLFGAMAACWIGLTFVSFVPGWALLPLMFLGGFFAGALWAFFPAFFKVRFGINEVISTLMLNYIASEFAKFLIVGPWKGESQHGYPYTDDLGASAVLPMIPGTRISIITLVLAIIGAVILFIVIFRTKFGYEVRVLGENHEAARYAGINFFKTTIIMMLISGGMAGLAGAGEMAGIHHHMGYPEAITSGYGFTGIIVAWLAKLNPVFVLISGFFFAGIQVGGDAIQISLNLPGATINIFNGIILIFLIMSEYFVNNRIKISFSKKHGETNHG